MSSLAKIDTTRHFLVIGTVSCEFEVIFKKKEDLEDALKEYDARMIQGVRLPLEFIEGCKVLQINQYLINDYCKHPTKRFIIAPQLIQYITVREVSW